MYQPIGDKVLTKIVGEVNEKIGNILLPDSAKEKPMQCEVLALGTGIKFKNGKKKPFMVKVGDVIITKKFKGTDIKKDGEEYKIYEQDDILAVIK